MGATSDNYEIVTDGITYTIASDYVNPFGGGTAHFQVMKIAYGGQNSVINTTDETPLPVSIINGLERYETITLNGFYALTTYVSGMTGTIGVHGISGAEPVGVTVGTVSVVGNALDIRHLNGGTVGEGTPDLVSEDYVRVQGIENAYPVEVAATNPLPVTVTSLSGFGIYGVSGATALGVTFGTVDVRGISYGTDSITVYGGGTAQTVSVGLHGFNGSTAEPIHSDSNAINVNIAKTIGLTVSADNLDIRALDHTTDNITVVGEGAADDTGLSTTPTYLNALSNDGNLLRVSGSTGSGWSGAALNVNVVNFDGISYEITTNISTIVGITAPYDSALPIQGSPLSDYGVWVVGDAAGGPVLVQGNSGGLLPVEVDGLGNLTSTIQSTIGQVKNNTDFLLAVKAALYSPSVSVSANDLPPDASIYNQIRDNVGDRLAAIQATIVPNGEYHTSQNSLSVNVTKIKRVASFLCRTGFVGNTPVNLSSFNAAQGYTCDMGVRIKVSRFPTGSDSSQNQIMCVISEADAAVYGASNVGASYVMYHGDEMFFEVDNIDKIKVFYPALSASNAPNNTASGLTFSFYAS